MDQDLILRGQEAAEVDVSAIAAKLDRTDILLLREFYLTRRPPPDDTQSHVLRLLVDKLQQPGALAGKRLSYGAIRYRVENLGAMGLLAKIPHTNPKIYYPLSSLVQQVRRIIFCFAAEVVGLRDGGDPG